MPIYAVHTAHPETGREDYINVVAHDAADAERRMQELGLVTAGVSMVDPDRADGFREDDIAFYIALAGILMFPLSIVGWVWGRSISEKTHGERGGRAWKTGKVVCLSWIGAAVVFGGLVWSALGAVDRAFAGGISDDEPIIVPYMSEYYITGSAGSTSGSVPSYYILPSPRDMRRYAGRSDTVSELVSIYTQTGDARLWPGRDILAAKADSDPALAEFLLELALLNNREYVDRCASISPSLSACTARGRTPALDDLRQWSGSEPGAALLLASVLGEPWGGDTEAEWPSADGATLCPPREWLETLAVLSDGVREILGTSTGTRIRMPTRPELIKKYRRDRGVWALVREMERMNGW